MAPSDRTTADASLGGGNPAAAQANGDTTEKRKMEVLPNKDDDPGCMTFVIHREDHTLGNPLRYLVMKNPAVQFCAYTIPHPSEDLIHFRIQTDGSITALDALTQGLDQLSQVSMHILESFDQALGRDDYDRVDEAVIDVPIAGK